MRAGAHSTIGQRFAERMGRLLDGALVTLAGTRAMLFVAGVALWALTSALPLGEAMGEGWDRESYWQVGLPLVAAAQVIATLLSTERMALAPFWILFGHLIAMIFVHPRGLDFGLMPLSVVFVGLPLYVMLFLAALSGRMVRRLTGFTP